jgi:hypothetical protein
MSRVDASTSETNSPQARQGFSRRQKLMLLGVVVINLCLYGMVFLMRGQGGPARNEPWSVVGKPLELQAAYEQALALSWQSDAQLVGATTSWQLAAGDRLTLHRPAWSFSFYSPAARQVQTVIVDQHGAQAGHRQSVSVAPQRAAPDWRLDSDDLLLTFLSYGGEDFISAHPSANVHLQLKGEETGRSTWYIIAVDPVARQSLIVGVDARSREIVKVEG